MTKEKSRMLVLAAIVVAMSFVFYAVDAYLYAKVFFEAGEQGANIDTVLPQWWIVMPILMGLFACGVGFGAWYGDYRTSKREDICGSLLLVFTPFVLVWSGLLDLHSAALIDYILWGKYAEGWFSWWWGGDWWWLNDPFNLGFGWSLPSWISGLLRLPTVPFWSVLLGAGIGACLVTTLWVLYWKYA